MARAEKFFDQEYTGRDFNTSTVTISNLEGDLYDYKVMLYSGYGQGDTSVGQYYLQLNSDTTSNYSYWSFRGDGANDADDDNASATSIDILETPGNTFTDATGFMSMIDITGSSGQPRSINTFEAGGEGDTVVRKTMGFWLNTADVITSLTIGNSDSDTYDARIVIYRVPKNTSQGDWQLIDKKTVSSSDINATPISFSGLSGDSDIQYRIHGELDFNASEILHYRFNSDTGSNYIFQLSKGGVSAVTYTETYMRPMWATASPDLHVFDTIINAESGEDRCVTSLWKSENTTGDEKTRMGGWWQNTAAELTQIDISTTTASSATGSVWLYRRKNPNTPAHILPFKQIYTKALSSTDFSAGETITVSGDDLELIKIEGLIKNTTGNIELRAQLNSDTGSNYEEQTVYTSALSAAAGSSTNTYFILSRIENADMSYFCFYLYPQNNGRSRPSICNQVFDENAIYDTAQWWSNTVDEVTSVKIYASSTDAITGNIKVSRLNI